MSKTYLAWFPHSVASGNGRRRGTRSWKPKSYKTRSASHIWCRESWVSATAVRRVRREDGQNCFEWENRCRQISPHKRSYWRRTCSGRRGRGSWNCRSRFYNYFLTVILSKTSLTSQHFALKLRLNQLWLHFIAISWLYQTQSLNFILYFIFLYRIFFMQASKIMSNWWTIHSQRRPFTEAFSVLLVTPVFKQENRSVPTSSSIFESTENDAGRSDIKQTQQQHLQQQ